MGGIIIGQLFRKRTVRNLSGQIIEMLDETDGSGVIISKGRVMNEAKVIEINKKEEDRKLAAVAFTQEISAPQAIVEERTIAPTKMQMIEQKVEEQDKKLDMILELLAKKKK